MKMMRLTLKDLPAVDTRPAFASWSTLPLYFGTVVFAFLGISLILPLQVGFLLRPNFFHIWIHFVFFCYEAEGVCS